MTADHSATRGLFAIGALLARALDLLPQGAILRLFLTKMLRNRSPELILLCHLGINHANRSQLTSTGVGDHRI